MFISLLSISLYIFKDYQNGIFNNRRKKDLEKIRIYLEKFNNLKIKQCYLIDKNKKNNFMYNII